MKNFKNKGRRKSSGAISETEEVTSVNSDPPKTKAEQGSKSQKSGRGLLGSKSLSRSMESLFKRGKGTKTYDINIDGGGNMDFPDVPVYTESRKPSRLSKTLSSPSSMPNFAVFKRSQSMDNLNDDSVFGDDLPNATDNTPTHSGTKDTKGTTITRPKGAPPPVPPVGPATRRLRSRSLDMSQYNNQMILTAIDIDVDRNEQFPEEMGNLESTMTDSLYDDIQDYAHLRKYGSKNQQNPGANNVCSDVSDDTSSVYSHSSSICTSVYSGGSGQYSTTTDHVYGNLDTLDEADPSTKDNIQEVAAVSDSLFVGNDQFGRQEHIYGNLDNVSSGNHKTGRQSENHGKVITVEEKRKIFKDAHEGVNHDQKPGKPAKIMESPPRGNQGTGQVTGKVIATGRSGVTVHQSSNVTEPEAGQDTLGLDDDSSGMGTMAMSPLDHNASSHKHVQIQCQNKNDNTDHLDLTFSGQNGQAEDHSSAVVNRLPGQLPGWIPEDIQNQTEAAAFNSSEDLCVHSLHDNSDEWGSTHRDINHSGQSDLSHTEVCEHDSKELGTHEDGNYDRDTHRKEPVNKDVRLEAGVFSSVRNRSGNVQVAKVTGVRTDLKNSPNLDSSQRVKSKKLISRPSVPPPKAPVLDSQKKDRALAFCEESSVDCGAEDIDALRETLLKFDIIIDDSDDQDQDDKQTNVGRAPIDLKGGQEQADEGLEDVSVNENSHIIIQEGQNDSDGGEDSSVIGHHHLSDGRDEKRTKHKVVANEVTCNSFIRCDEVRKEPTSETLAHHVSRPDLPAVTHKKISSLFKLQKNEDRVTHNNLVTPESDDKWSAKQNKPSGETYNKALETDPIHSELKHRLRNLRKTQAGGLVSREGEEESLESSNACQKNSSVAGSNMVQKETLPISPPKPPVAVIGAGALTKSNPEVKYNLGSHSSQEASDVYDDVGFVQKKALLPPNFAHKNVSRNKDKGRVVGHKIEVKKEDSEPQGTPVKSNVKDLSALFSSEKKINLRDKCSENENAISGPKSVLKPKPKVPPKSKEALRKFRESVGSNSSDAGIASPTSPRGFSPNRGYSPSRSLSPHSLHDAVFHDFDTVTSENYMMEENKQNSPGGPKLSPGLNATTAAYIKSSTPKGFTPSPNKSYKIHFHSPTSKSPPDDSENRSKQLYTQVNKDKARPQNMVDLSPNIKLSDYKSKLKEVKVKNDIGKKAIIKRRPTIPKKPKGVLNKLTRKSTEALADGYKVGTVVGEAEVMSEGEDMHDDTGDSVSLSMESDDHGSMSGDLYDDTLYLRAHTSSTPASLKKTLFKKQSGDTSPSSKAGQVLHCASHANHDERSPAGDTYDDVGHLGGIASEGGLSGPGSQLLHGHNTTGKPTAGRGAIASEVKYSILGEAEPIGGQTDLGTLQIKPDKEALVMKLKSRLALSLASDNVVSESDSKQIDMDVYEDIGSPFQPDSPAKHVKQKRRPRYDEVCATEDTSEDDEDSMDDKVSRLGRTNKPRFMIVPKPMSTNQSTGGYDPEGLYEELPEEIHRPSRDNSNRSGETSEVSPDVMEQSQTIKSASGNHSKTPVARIPPFRPAVYDEVCLDEFGIPVINGFTNQDLKSEAESENNATQKQNKALSKFASLMKQNKLNFSKLLKGGDSKDNSPPTPPTQTTMSAPNLTATTTQAKAAITYADLDKSFLNKRLDDRSSLGSNSESASSVELRENRQTCRELRMGRSHTMNEIQDSLSQSYSSADSVSIHSGSDSAISELNDPDQMSLEDRRKQLKRMNQKVHKALGAKHLSKLYVATLKEKTATLKEKTSNLKKIPKIFSKSATNLNAQFTIGARKSLGDLSGQMQRMFAPGRKHKQPVPDTPYRDYSSDADFDDGWSDTEFDEDYYASANDNIVNKWAVPPGPNASQESDDIYLTPTSGGGENLYLEPLEDQDNQNFYEVPYEPNPTLDKQEPGSAPDDSYLTAENYDDYVEPDDDQDDDHDYVVPDEGYPSPVGNPPVSGYPQTNVPPIPSRANRPKSRHNNDGDDYLDLIEPEKDNRRPTGPGPQIPRRDPPPLPPAQHKPNQFRKPIPAPIQPDEDSDQDDYIEPIGETVPLPPLQLPPRHPGAKDIQYPPGQDLDDDDYYEAVDNINGPPPPPARPNQRQPPEASPMQNIVGNLNSHFQQRQVRAKPSNQTPHLPVGRGAPPTLPKQQNKATPPAVPLKPKPAPPAKPGKHVFTPPKPTENINSAQKMFGAGQRPNGFHAMSSDSEHSGNGDFGSIAPKKHALKPPTPGKPEARRPTSPGHQSSPGQGRPTRALPAIPPIPGTTPSRSSGSSEDLDGLYSYHWFFGTLHRVDVEERLRSDPSDGVFLVRKSNNGGADRPYTLSLIYNQKVWNLHIRRRTVDGTYALGHFKPSEKTFKTVPDLVDYHTNKNLILAGSLGGETTLNKCPRKR